MNILAVDDERDARAFLSDLLSEEGHRVMTVSNAVEAAATLRRVPVDVVLLDLMMPGTDGFRLAREVSENWSTSQIPLIAISCLSDPESKACAKALGCVRYFEKPFVPGELLEALRDIERGGRETVPIGTR
jgi:two-component system OmpR family response regulator